MGVIVWEGPSEIDGSPILGVLTCTDDNTKLTRKGHGRAVQLWIIPREHPIDALRSGRDRAVCGSCQFRPWVADESGVEQPVHRTCYVSLNPIISVHRHAVGSKGAPDRPRNIPPRSRRMTPRGAFKRWRADLLRLGAYGDPAAMPYEVVREIADEARAAGIPARTGYTQRWPVCDVRFRHLLMASCVGALQGLQARLMGWRPFVVTPAGEEFRGELFGCPASDEAGHRKTCAECGACDGVREDRPVDLRPGAGIFVHGQHVASKLARVEHILKRQTEELSL